MNSSPRRPHCRSSAPGFAPRRSSAQSNCTRSIRTEAVGIGRLERFVVERHYENAEHVMPKASGKKVAVIGSGPSGLSVAQRLRDKGHAVVVYEKDEKPGGLLRYGIPNMKLEKGTLDRKLDAMRAQGIVFKTGVEAGADLSAETLDTQYDAVVLCVGTGNARKIQMFGAEALPGSTRRWITSVERPGILPKARTSLF